MSGFSGVRRLTFESSLDYYENTAGQLESRETQGTFRVEFNTSDQIGFEVTDAFEHLSAPFDIAPGVSVPVGHYRFTQARATWFMSAARRASGFASLTIGEFYGGTIRELSWGGRVQLTARPLLGAPILLHHVGTPLCGGD